MIPSSRESIIMSTVNVAKRWFNSMTNVVRPMPLKEKLSVVLDTHWLFSRWCIQTGKRDKAHNRAINSTVGFQQQRPEQTHAQLPSPAALLSISSVFSRACFRGATTSYSSKVLFLLFFFLLDITSSASTLARAFSTLTMPALAFDLPFPLSAMIWALSSGLSLLHLSGLT